MQQNEIKKKSPIQGLHQLYWNQETKDFISPFYIHMLIKLYLCSYSSNECQGLK